MKIERKIAIGYTIIVALIGGIVYTYLHEWRQMNRLEREVKEIHRLRQNVHEAYVHMLDLTMFGETILEWERADTTLYRAKRLKVDSILCEFKDYYSGERIDSLRVLMAIGMSSGNNPSRAGDYRKRQTVWHSVISTST